MISQKHLKRCLTFSGIFLFLLFLSKPFWREYVKKRPSTFERTFDVMRGSAGHHFYIVVRSSFYRQISKENFCDFSFEKWNLY